MQLYIKIIFFHQPLGYLHFLSCFLCLKTTIHKIAPMKLCRYFRGKASFCVDYYLANALLLIS